MNEMGVGLGVSVGVGLGVGEKNQVLFENGKI